MVEITYELDNPTEGVYATISNLYVDDADPLSYIWHTQPSDVLRKRRIRNRDIVSEISITSNETHIDLRADADIYHALGPYLYRRNQNLGEIWSVLTNKAADVTGVTATGGSGPCASSENRLYLYNPEDGGFRWSRETPSAEDVADLTADDDRNIYAVEASGETVRYATTSHTEWRRTDRFGDMIEAWKEDYVYVVARNANDIVQLRAADGATLWNRNNDFSRPSGLGAAADGDAVIIHENGVARLSATDGSTVWNNTGIDYQDSRTDVSARKNGDIIVIGNGSVGALDPATGAEQWSTGTDPTSNTFSMVSYPRPGPYYSELW